MPVNSAFLADLVARLPEASRGSVLAVFEQPEAAEAVRFADEGAKRQSDYSRAMDEARSALAAKTRELEDLHAANVAKAEELRVWYDGNKVALDAGWKALNGTTPAPGTTPAATPAALPPDLVRREDVERIITEREMGAAQYMHTLVPLGLKHLQEFGEVLDLNALFRDPAIKEIGLLGVYERSVADRRREAATKAEQARIDQAVEARLATERKKGIPPPYPVSPMDVSPLDQFTPNPAASPFSVDAAVDEYHKLASQRAAREAVPR